MILFFLEGWPLGLQSTDFRELELDWEDQLELGYLP